MKQFVQILNYRQNGQRFGLVGHGLSDLSFVDIEVHHSGSGVECADGQDCMMRTKGTNLQNRNTANGLPVITVEGVTNLNCKRKTKGRRSSQRTGPFESVI